jgi:hypothetical protein
MRTRNVIAILAVAILAFAAGRYGVRAGSVASAGETQDPARAEAPANVQAIADAGTPGPHHRHLETFIGEWSGTFTIRMGPDAEPLVSRGTVKREWILGGRFVSEVVTAETPAGPFEGRGYIGFNNLDGRFETVWMDNMSTSIMTETGTYHPEEKVMHTRGTQRDPVTGRLINSWAKIDLSDPDRHVMTGYATDADGRTYKAMEGVLERNRP